jgi:hypothetical protein
MPAGVGCFLVLPWWRSLYGRDAKLAAWFIEELARRHSAEAYPLFKGAFGKFRQKSKRIAKDALLDCL